jgi:putative RecB family exonuclease
MPRRLFACTPTRLLSWLDCPRRYRFAYLDRPTPPKGPAWAHNSLGASVHNALRAWWDQPQARRSVAAGADLVARAWVTDGYRDQEQSTRARSSAQEMVQRYLSGLDPLVQPRGVERTVAFTTEHLAVSGRVDRIDERTTPGGGPARALVVVDYKTGRSPLGPEDTRGSLALALYALGARRTLRGVCHRVELHHLPTGTVAGWDHTDESLGRHLRRAESLAAQAAAAEAVLRAGTDADEAFPARTGTWCGWCDFREHCPPGRAAAPRMLPWDGLADPIR